jgi:hypothetical protein
MSDENLINVEDDGPELPAPDASAAAGEPIPEPVAAGAPEPDGDIDLNAVDVKDEARIKGLIGELSRKRAENKTLRQQAEKAAQLEQELAQSRPYVDFLRNNQHLLQPQQPREEKPAAPEADPDAVEAARLMDFYKPDGQPDVERGARWLALQDKRAGRVAEQRIAPTVQQSLQDKANANYQMLRNFALPNGEKLKSEIVDGIWTMAAREPNGLQTLANPDSVRALALLAIGAQSLGTPTQPAAPAKPPVVTEAVVGRGALSPAVRLSGVEERTIAQRGMKPEQYAALTKNFQAGRSNVLEED